MSTIGEQPEPPRQDADEETGSIEPQTWLHNQKGPVSGAFPVPGAGFEPASSGL